MPRLPKRVKFRKQMRGNLRKASCGNYIAFGEYACRLSSPIGSPLDRSKPVVSRPSTSCVVRARSSSGSSRTSRSPRSRWKREWARARRTWITGPHA